MRIRNLRAAFIALVVVGAGCSSSPVRPADAFTDTPADVAGDAAADAADVSPDAQAPDVATGTDVATDAGTDATPICMASNPSSVCRTSVNDCIPTTCRCTDSGWACTADCGGGRLCPDAGSDATVDPAERCQATGGAPVTAQCCLATGAFPNSCGVGACSCSLQNSHAVSVCLCPTGNCFLPQRGCVVPACTPGADQTCNDSLLISSLHGHCLPDLTCMCGAGFTLNAATGKCL